MGSADLPPWGFGGFEELGVMPNLDIGAFWSPDL